MNPAPNASAIPASSKPSLAKLGFRVRWFTSEEKTNPASELLTSSPSSKGWQSSRFCTYPQEIVLQLLQPSRLRQIQFLSHQSKISSKVEVLVCQPDGNADLKFKKLGFLTFDSNERTAFQSRELKSVFLDANCLYVKLVFHKYHPNKQNLFNQVGLIALSCFGEPSNGLQFDRFENLRERGEPQSDNVVTQFDNITMDRLRTLEAAKDRAVQNEEFEEAKRLKEAMSRLKQIALKLKQLEERKQLAVRNEDYESAKIIKAEIERLRNGVAPEFAMNRPAPLYFAPSPVIKSQREDVDQGLGSNRQQYQQQQQQLREQPAEEGEDEFNGDKNRDDRNESAWQQQQNNNNLNQDSEMLSNKLDQQGQERSIRLNNNNNNNNSFLNNNNNNSNFQDDQFEQSEQDVKDFQQPAAIPNHDDMVIPAIRNQTEKKPWEEDAEDQANGAARPEVPEGLSVENKKAAGILAPALSQEYAEALYSKSWQAREQTIKALEKELSAPGKIVTTDMQQLFTAMTTACAVSMADKVSQVSLAGVSLFIALCGSKTIKPTSSKGDLQPNFESALSVLAELAAAPKSKTPAIKAFFAAAELQPTGGLATIISSLARPQGGIRQKTLNAPKYVVARIQVLDEFIKKNNKDTPIAPILEFTTKQILHANGDVRAAATALIVNAAKTLGMPQVETYIASLPEEKRQLVMTEIQGGEKKKPFSPTKEQTKKPGQLPGATSVDGKAKKAPAAGAAAAAKKKKILSAKGKKEPTAEQLESNVCEFCNKFSKEFGDKSNMDIHLWRECPMLLACPHCAQVIEVSLYNQHLLEECADSKKFKQCKRCQEPILNTEFDAHTKSASCSPAQPIASANRCPLCHQDIEPGIDGWKQHLAVKTCPNNERSNK